MKNLLIIEDDFAIAKGLEESLNNENYKVIVENDGEKGYQKAKNENLDLIILDIILPGKNGIEICKDLRNENINIPILMLTSRKEEVDKVLGLEIGADDYMTKPFSIRELEARIKALLRRQPEIKKDLEEYSFDKIHIDFKKQVAFKNKNPIDFSSTEFKILKYFILHEGEVVSREMLLDDVWGYDSFPTTRTVDNYILSIRKKVEDNTQNPKYLLTIPKAGYKFQK